MRRVMTLSFCLCMFFAHGCGGSDEKSPKADFLAVAKKMGDAPTAEHVINVVEKQYASGEKFAWADLDRFMMKSSGETIAAYKTWRDATIAAHNK